MATTLLVIAPNAPTLSSQEYGEIDPGAERECGCGPHRKLIERNGPGRQSCEPVDVHGREPSWGHRLVEGQAKAHPCDERRRRARVVDAEAVNGQKAEHPDCAQRPTIVMTARRDRGRKGGRRETRPVRLAERDGKGRFGAHFQRDIAESYGAEETNARRKRRRKHGDGRLCQDSNLDDLAGPETRDPLEVLAVHEALDQLAEKAPRKAELVKLRYFLGCTMAEAAQVLGISQATAQEDWTYSKAWLRRRWFRGEQQKEAPG